MENTCRANENSSMCLSPHSAPAAVARRKSLLFHLFICGRWWHVPDSRAGTECTRAKPGEQTPIQSPWTPANWKSIQRHTTLRQHKVDRILRIFFPSRSINIWTMIRSTGTHTHTYKIWYCAPRRPMDQWNLLKNVKETSRGRLGQKKTISP